MIGLRQCRQEVGGDPAVDAPALFLKNRDDLSFGAPEELDEVGRRIVARP
jgi:hypothetical protein